MLADIIVQIFYILTEFCLLVLPSVKISYYNYGFVYFSL